MSSLCTNPQPSTKVKLIPKGHMTLVLAFLHWVHIRRENDESPSGGSIDKSSQVELYLSPGNWLCKKHNVQDSSYQAWLKNKFKKRYKNEQTQI